MIARLRVADFQALHAVELDLGRLTVVTGPSNVGKSSLVRAVRVLLTNPRGDWYVRLGAKQTAVSLTTDTHVVSFSRTGGKPAYVLREAPVMSPHGRREFTAVGSHVPEPVDEVLRIDPEIQVADQFDMPFLLSESPAGRARLLGALTNADLAMAAVTYAQAQARNNASHAKSLAKIIEGDRTRMDEEFGWYPEQAHALARVQPIVGELHRLRERLSAASRLLARLQGLAPRVAPSAPLRSAEKLASRLPSLVALHEIASERWVKAEAALAQIYMVHAAIMRQQNAVVEAERAEAVAHGRLIAIEADLDTCPTCGQELSVEAKERVVAV